jgi:hypothetical protein
MISKVVIKLLFLSELIIIYKIQFSDGIELIKKINLKSKYFIKKMLLLKEP